MDFLIPGLPDDVARECLVRVQYQDFRAAASVCKRWKAEIESPDFLVRRKAAGTSQVLVALRHDSPARTMGFGCGDFQLSVFEPLSGRWFALPRSPGSRYGSMWSCPLAAIGSDLVVFVWPKAVWIYNIQTSRWRSGADMPRMRRSGFACATDGERMIYVAGGTSSKVGRLRSAMAYDLKTDQWDVSMPAMSRGGSDSYNGIFRSGRFQVITRASQRSWDIIIQTFDPSTRCWEPARVLQPGAHSLEHWVNGNDTFDTLCVDSRVIIGCKGSRRR